MKLVSIVSLLLAALALETVNSIPSRSVAGHRVVCYYGSWAVYRYGPVKIANEDIDTSKCTELIFTFVGLNDVTAKSVFMDPWNDIGDEWHKGALPTLRKKTKDTGTNFIVAIGGWNEGSERYSKTVRDPVKRASLVSSLVDMADTYDLDGIDLDWEYPSQRGGAPEDRDNFSLLCKELAEKLHARGKTLSAAVNANALLINISYDVPRISTYLDYINVMAYDLHGSWEDKTGHNAPLFGHHTDLPGEEHLNVAVAMKTWIDLGCPPQKLNMGLGFYGRSFNLLNPSQNGIGAPAGGTPPCGWIDEPGFYAYKEICTNNGTVWKTEWDDEQQVPYAYNGNKWVGYDDERSIYIKTCYAKSIGLGGMMLWSVETDDFDGSCKNGKFPLLNAIAAALQDPTCGSSGNNLPPITTPSAPVTPTSAAPEITTPAAPEVVTTAAPEVVTTAAPEVITTAAPEVITTVAPEVITTAAPEVITTAAPEVQTPVATPEAPTTSPPTSVPVCNQVGTYIRDPVDCNVFYYCATGADGRPTPNRFTCASQLAFDEQIKTCVRRSATRC